jgi:glutathione S-transferase
MKLVGMLDSPYVRRVAVSFRLLGLACEHQPLSVFRAFDAFHAINPVVKAPTLVCDDGVVLMDSTLILQYGEALARPRSLTPSNPKEIERELRLIGLALAACEKSVQIVYERGQRPPEKLHQPWVDRVSAQLLAAYDALEQELARATVPVTSGAITQAGVTVAVAWSFTQKMVPDVVAATRCPALAALSAQVEARLGFRVLPPAPR